MSVDNVRRLLGSLLDDPENANAWATLEELAAGDELGQAGDEGRALLGETRRKLQESLVLVHGGMAQNVGPILEMVTEKYLLRSEAEWAARKEAAGSNLQCVQVVPFNDPPPTFASVEMKDLLNAKT